VEVVASLSPTETLLPILLLESVVNFSGRDIFSNEQEGGWRLWLHSLKVAQLPRSAACLHTNQSRSYLNHLVLHFGVATVYKRIFVMLHIEIILMFLYCK